jgi:5,10-methylenetetrahydrofolate reductase
LNNEVPGINIPEEIMHRMEKNEGLIIAREILNEIKKVCQGVCIMSPFKRYEWVEQILKE